MLTSNHCTDLLLQVFQVLASTYYQLDMLLKYWDQDWSSIFVIKTALLDTYVKMYVYKPCLVSSVADQGLQ